MINKLFVFSLLSFVFLFRCSTNPANTSGTDGTGTNGSNYIGTWTGVTSVNGYATDLTLEIRSDKTYTITILDVAQNGTWSLNGSTLVLDNGSAILQDGHLMVTSGSYTWDCVLPSSKPSTPSITAIGDESSVIVSWVNAAGATSYDLYYAAGTTVDSSKTKLTGVTSPKIVTGLTNGTEYAFAMVAVNANGESGMSAVKTATPMHIAVDTVFSHYVGIWLRPSMEMTYIINNDSTFSALSGGFTAYHPISVVIGSGKWKIENDTCVFTDASGNRTGTARLIGSILIVHYNYYGSIDSCSASRPATPTIKLDTMPGYNCGCLSVSWTIPGGTASYNLYYKASSTVDTNGIKLENVNPPMSVTGLTYGTEYAFAVVAINSAGASGLSNIVTATLLPVVTGTMSDIDGNVYHTVNIGTQVWMSENLKTTKYNDGTAIPVGTYSTNTSGVLYNWDAVNTGKLAPSGWHIPSDSEWSVLTTYLGGENVAGGKLKEDGTAHWKSPNTGATNETGFSALPGCFNGYCDSYGEWWSSTVSGWSNSWGREMRYDDMVVSSGLWEKINSISVRCIRDTGAPVAPSITTQPQPYTVNAGQSVTLGVMATGTPPLLYQWYKDGTAISGATLSNYTVSNVQAADTGTYTVSISNGVLPNVTSNGAVLKIYGTVTDIEGNNYHTVTIGTQVWMAENLRTTKYKDGTPIPLITDAAQWSNLTTPGYCWYNNDITNKNIYGALYNWYSLNTGNLAPIGWHVPTDEEWTLLITSLGGYDVAGGKLKDTGTTYWRSPNTGATNTSGFSALPGGYRTNSNGTFCSVDSTGYWWSSSVMGAADSWYRSIYYNYAIVSRDYGMNCSFSVRCVKD